MRIVVKGRHMRLTPPLRAHVEEKIEASVQRITEPVAGRLEVELDSHQGARHGPTHVCRVNLRLPHRRPLVISQADDDMYAAIDRAHHRLMRGVQRRVRRGASTRALRQEATRQRQRLARRGMTAQPEIWEREQAAYEAASHASLLM